MAHKIRGVDVEKYAYYINKPRQKRWFGNMTMTPNCDVTNSAHLIQMTTICHWMKSPMEIFCVRHWSTW